jgi:hypothetical protein
MAMSEDERERACLRYILDSIVRIERYTRGNQSAFLIEQSEPMPVRFGLTPYPTDPYDQRRQALPIPRLP